jgi:hypothetical protein
LPPAWGITAEIGTAWCDLVCDRAAFLVQHVDDLCANL